MIILNTTYYVHHTIDCEFRQWVRERYFSSALGNGLSSPSLARILVEPRDGMSGYAVQFRADDLKQAENWHDGLGSVLRGELVERYGTKILSFTTYMEVL